MTGLSIRGIFGTDPMSWTLWTILRKVLRAFLEDSATAVPPTIILMSPMGGPRRSFSRRGACSSGVSVLSLLLQVTAVGCVVPVVLMKATILVSESFVGVSLQLSRESHCTFIFDLDQYLVDHGG